MRYDNHVVIATKISWYHCIMLKLLHSINYGGKNKHNRNNVSFKSSSNRICANERTFLGKMSTEK